MPPKLSENTSKQDLVVYRPGKPTANCFSHFVGVLLLELSDFRS